MTESIGMEFDLTGMDGKSRRSSQSIVLLVIDSIDPTYMHGSDTGF
jgi:hypothetical protein